ncbi:MAG TPA: alpha-amylase, partial [Cyanobacteria bacterium UBA11371]|nr:alpha-amylase [Cyanobacteria bacterium UBA11371]
ITNHDQERLIRSLGDAGIFDDEAFKRVKLGAILLMTAPGIPMIWMGQEFGEYKNREPNQPKKLEWDLLKNERNRDLFEFYKRLIAFRKQNSALKSTQVDFIHANPEGKVLAYARSDGQESQVIVVANFSDQSFESYQISDFPNGNWQLWGSDRTLEITDNQLTLELPANEAQIFVLQ